MADPERMSDERLAEIRALANGISGTMTRPECRELLDEIDRLRAEREQEEVGLRMSGFNGRDGLWEQANKVPGMSATLDERTAERDALATKVAEQARQLRILNDAARKRNVQLDALHFVWCSGGCEGGTHRFEHGELTPEVVREATRNTARLATRWITMAARLEPDHASDPAAAVARVQARLYAAGDFAPLREAQETPPWCDADRLREALRSLVEHTRKCARFLSEAMLDLQEHGSLEEEDDEAILAAAHASKAADEAAELLAGKGATPCSS